MKYLFGIAVFLGYFASFFAPTDSRIDVSGSGPNACLVYYHYSQKYRKKIGGISISWITKYRTVTRSKWQCCAGWQTSNGVNCDLAICDSKTNLNKACHRWVAAGLIVKPDGSSVTFSEGSCYLPQKCQKCAKGFWPKNGGPYCEVCPQIANCDFEECSDTHQICARCNGDYGMTGCNEASPKQIHGCSAFFTNPLKTACMELCSWRTTSTACWPGECGPKGHKTDCKCHPWFTGPECMTITKPPEILFVLIKLDKHIGGDHYRNLMQNDPNELKITRVYWTNAEATHLDLKAKANHTAKLSPRPKYVSKDKAKTNIGIVRASVTIISRPANGTARTSAYPLCGGKSFVAAPEGKEPVNCQAWEVLGGKMLQHVIEHGASLEIEVVYVAGGFVTIIDLDRGMNNKETRHDYIEITSKYKTTFKWDLHKPYSTSNDHFRLSTEKAKTVDQTITGTWQGWSDDDSQVHDNVTVGVTRLEAVGKELKDHCGGGEAVIPTATGSRSFNVKKPGVYSVILTVSDIAGNHERSRRFFTYDPGSKLQIMTGTNASFSSAASNTSYDDQWQHNTDIAIPVVYTISEGRFINPNHTHGNWLGAILKCHGMNDTYDDNDRLRTTSSIRNNRGVVEMEIGYLQYRSLDRPNTPVPYKSIDIFTTTNSFNIVRKDGDTIEMFIKVTDYMNRFFEESKKVRIDSSPPVILNVALWREGVKRLAVHNSTELRTMTFEWWAFDYDTCLKQVEWTIYDNHTTRKEIFYHGHQKIGHQGRHKDLAACKKKYFEAPNGPDCYATIYHGACHKHFRVTPQVSTGGLNGLHPDRKEALHDVDLFINITVINWANLKSTFVKKISIDKSRPRRGVVHDGLPGAPDVDYQSSRNLAAYWDGFFDHESGIVYFQYAWGTSCQGTGVFGIKYDSAKVKKTTQTSAQWTAPSKGKYFITVVAFNAALDHSEPVCSNGVMVDETGPVMGGSTIENTVTKPGLLKQGGKVYYIRKDRRRVRIEKPSSSCLAKATETTDITIYSDAVFPNGTLVTESTKFCQSQRPLSLTAVTPLTKDSYISANWTAHDNESGIQSYQFGLMSNKGASAAPDILPYTPTVFGSRGHFKLRHPDLTAGKVFYVGIIAKNKASLTTEKVFGPFVVEVTHPIFTGKIETHAKNGELVATWPANGFVDGESADPFTYEYAVGTSPSGIEVVSWSPLVVGADCKLALPPTPSCTHIPMKSRRLHAGDTYYVSIKATNFVGQSAVVTVQVKHYADPPAKGMVRDVAPASEQPIVSLGQHDDIDFQKSKKSLAVAWTNLGRPYHTTQYRVAVGTTSGGVDVVAPKTVTGSSYRFDGLNLVAFMTYYTTVWAKNVNGEVKITTDGVKVIDQGATVNAKVFDGPRPCPTLVCTADIDYQASTSSLSAHWSIPSNMVDYVSHVYWKIEQQDDVMDSTSWKTFEPFALVQMSGNVTRSNLGLVSGKRYRSVLRPCHGTVCFSDVYSDGVLILAKLPAGGLISEVLYKDKTIKVALNRFVDVDIPELYSDFRRSVIDVYHWTVTTNNQPGQNIEDWRKADVNILADKTKGEFTAVFDHPLAFKDCYRLALRGTSKSGLSTTLFKEVKACDTIKPFEPTVIDAVGLPVIDQATKTIIPNTGQPITKKLNDAWRVPDQDYTSYKNILSATWPSLRHRKYKYAVIVDSMLKPFGHKDRPDQMIYKDPCSLPTAIKCGETEHEFANVELTLTHGRRYYICVHADAMTKKHEKWTEPLAEVNSCSDGITVDLTAPKPGKVWVGAEKGETFLRSHTEMSVNWSGFEDVEEHGQSPDLSGIKYYEYGVGSLPGVDDIAEFKNVGFTTHHLIHGLNLQSGSTYYVTVRATDYVNLTANATSKGATVDTTPPVKNNVTMKSHHTTSAVVFASWEGVFLDSESGISHYEWAVGSQPGYADIMPNTVTAQTYATSTSSLDMQEGYVYYVSVKAFNKAGLSSLATDWPLLFDPSPPVLGYVFDGSRDQATAGRKDQNFQRDDDHIWAYWDFSDPHSGVVSYSWSVGTCVGCGDILKDHPVGANTDAVATNLEVTLCQGKTYYATVTACNGVGLCSTASSDGVLIDSTPPIKGLVQDGVGLQDIDYQNHRKYVGAKWWGFLDAQSGISYYSWWIGTTLGGNELMKEERLHHSEMAYRLELPGGIQLPVDIPIYITVKATNHVGLSTTATSNGFKVITAPPSIGKAATHIESKGSVYKNTQVFGSAIGVSWEFDSSKCPIRSQHIRLHADRFHRRDMPTVPIGSTFKSYFLTNVSLIDGTSYFVSVIACNLAMLCTTSTTPKILADNSPPLTGMVAIDTEHAAELSREEAGHWTYTADSLSFAVLGFSDAHSGIKYYDVSVGTMYGGNDITNGKVIRFSHGPSPWSRRNEGTIQKLVLNGENITSGKFKAVTEFYVSVVGINGVGLESAVLIKKFRKLIGGGLALIRRCQYELCKGHCVCSPQNAKCDGPTQLCTTKSSGLKLSVYDVVDIHPNTSPVDISHSPSTSVLAAWWKVDPTSTVQPIGYDYAVGLTARKEPTGLSSRDNIIWRYVGRSQSAIHTLGPHDESLLEGAKYSVFVRAWTSRTEYGIFKSNGVEPAVKSPSLSKKQAATVKDCRYGDPKKGTSAVKDVDVYNRTDMFCVSWKNAFQGRSWDKYYVSLGTYPGGQDTLKFQTQSSTTFSVELSNLKSVPGRRYYSNVRACNKAGLCNERYSDGVLIDTFPPLTGVVNDGTGLHDEDYQNRTNLVAAHWQGWADLGSGIDRYMWCVGKTPAKDECGVKTWTNVGLQTRIQKLLSTPLTAGRKIYNKVYAVDGVGHQSSVVVSDGVMIDRSPPDILTKLKFGDNVINNPSFEDNPGPKMAAATSITTTPLKTIEPTGWKAKGTTVVTPVDEALLAKQGRQFLLLYGSLFQTLTGLVIGTKYVVTLYASHIHPSHSPGPTRGRVQLPDGKGYVFSLQNRTYRHDVFGKTSITAWNKHVCYFVATSTSGDITISSVGARSGIAFDDVVVKQIQDGDASPGNSYISSSFKTPMHVYGFFTAQGDTLHLGWDFEDKESPIVEYKYAVGKRKGGSVISYFKSVGLKPFTQVTDRDLKLIHNSSVYVTVIARNAAGLKKILLSDPIKIDKTPPVIHHVWDGTDKDGDIAHQDSSTVKAQWSVDDPESGIEYCEYGIGSRRGILDIQHFKKVQGGASKISHALNQSEVPARIYTSIRCHNFAGGATTMTSNGVAFAQAKPSTKSAWVRIMSRSPTVYPNQWSAAGIHQSQTDELFLRWDGFEDPNGISNYEVNIRDIAKSGPIWDQWITVPGNMKYLRIHDLKLKAGGTYELVVRAVNVVGKRSSKVATRVIISSTPPTVNTGKTPELTWSIPNKLFTMDWSGLFSKKPFYYEVCLGTVQGGADIKLWQETTSANVTIELETAWQSSGTFYATITAVNPAGLSTKYLHTIHKNAIKSKP
ncbi:uncharacterized protein LOC135499763 [Lineus longissimus]|uniref:uncharacterized protein LOC135499763 n=1 Tax=Lineus longissimus TaxID=88925 RepID=UPI002B4D8F4D